MNTFDKRAPEWDRPERINMAGAVSQAMIKALNPEKTMIVADIGAGTGLIALEFAKKTKSVTAMDSSEGMLAILREKISFNSIDNVSIIVFDAEKDEPPNTKFDIVVSSMAMHHFSDTEAFALKLNHMLRDNGRFAIADLEKEDGSFHHKDNQTGVSHHGFDRESIKKIFEAAGFRNIEFTTAFTAVRDGKDFPLFLMTGEK